MPALPVRSMYVIAVFAAYVRALVTRVLLNVRPTRKYACNRSASAGVSMPRPADEQET